MLSRKGVPAEDRIAKDREEALGLFPVSRETIAAFEVYVALLQRWQGIKNLVGPETLARVWTRHLVDSAQLVQWVPEGHVFVDIGSGAGFPGLVLAILLQTREGFQMHLVESNGRKVAFLREVSRQLGLPVKVHDVRVEEVGPHLPDKIDCLTARALAPLKTLLDMQALLTKNPCIGLFPKGQDIDAELTEASKYWNIQAKIHPSITDPRGHIVEVAGFSKRV
jgi:16S rRNA (guanine527-N7)-methyltransferase